MSSSDLRARMDGLEGLGKADAVYPEPLSRHNRGLVAQQQVGKQHSTLGLTSVISAGDLEEPHHEEALFQGMRSGDLECSPHMYKRTVKKKQDRRGRFRTQPVTFMEIKVILPVFDRDLADFSFLSWSSFFDGKRGIPRNLEQKGYFCQKCCSSGCFHLLMRLCWRRSID